MGLCIVPQSSTAVVQMQLRGQLGLTKMWFSHTKKKETKDMCHRVVIIAEQGI